MAKPLFALTLLLLALPAVVAEPKADDLATRLRDLSSPVVAADDGRAKELPAMLAANVRDRLRAAGQRETKLWREIKNKADWERYRDPRLQALRESLGTVPARPKDFKVSVTRSLDGEGYRIDNIVFESRPGLLVTANLYSPKEALKSMPGIVICPSHHNPKTEGELQDMGVSWARQGCVVLVPDNLGHGERRQHPFRDAQSFDGKFRSGRQDYYFRYNVGMQLHLAGESPTGWMVGDLLRCVDVLHQRPGIDKERIVLLGAVAGGGDPAAVAGALDDRIAIVAPFNFGGPQPETIYPLPENADDAFNYIGGGGWEPTRNLRLSARDGFLPWVIVAGIAPRRLLYSHEFSWDRDRDPVWTRLQKVYGYYDHVDRVAGAHGKGQLSGKPPEASHCNNIGPLHRQSMAPALNRWLGQAIDKDHKDRHKADELLCLTPDALKALSPKPVHELAAAHAAEQRAAFQRKILALTPAERDKESRARWSRLLGDVAPTTAKVLSRQTEKFGAIAVERVLLETEPGIVVPLILLIPARKGDAKLPVVVGLAQEGKQAFLRERSAAIAELLHGGAAVCLPDARGTGETRPSGDSRGRGSAGTSLSSSELMLGETLLGKRLKDVHTLMRYLRGRDDVDGKRLALWGDSFAAVNAPDTNVQVPWDAEKLPAQSEPLGGLLALFAAASDADVKAVAVRGGLVNFATVLDGPFCHLPHDVIVPGLLGAGDLDDVAAGLAPRALRLESLVDGVNRAVSLDKLGKSYAATKAAYANGEGLSLRAEADGKQAAWLLHALGVGR